MLAKCDANGDGRIGKQELPLDLLIVRRVEVGEILGAEIPLTRVFDFFDTDGDGRYDRAEWARAPPFRSAAESTACSRFGPAAKAT